ncbi:MAG: hypothetical protein ACOVOR_05235 [Rhabdochlamydiaceae bacterium]
MQKKTYRVLSILTGICIFQSLVAAPPLNTPLAEQLCPDNQENTQEEALSIDQNNEQILSQSIQEILTNLEEGVVIDQEGPISEPDYVNIIDSEIIEEKVIVDMGFLQGECR